jgi:hypothetical protein
MSTLTERTWIDYLFRPFVYVAGGKALGLGVVVIALTGLLGSIGSTHLDGVLDLHSGASAPLWLFPVEGLADWLCLALVLLVFGKIISQTAFRVVDVLGTQALARWPSLVMVLITLPPAFLRYSQALVHQIQTNPMQLPPISADAIYFFAATLLVFPFLIWQVVLMYQAFAISCNVRGAKAIVTFFVGLVAAEILSKFVIVTLWHAALPHA